MLAKEKTLPSVQSAGASLSIHIASFSSHWIWICIMVVLIVLLCGGTQYKHITRELQDSQIKRKQLAAELEAEVIELKECQVKNKQLEAELEAEVSGMLK